MKKYLKALMLFSGAFVLGLAAGAVLNFPRFQQQVRTEYCDGAAVVANSGACRPTELQEAGLPFVFMTYRYVPNSVNEYSYEVFPEKLIMNLLIPIILFESFALAIYMGAKSKK